MYSHSSFEPHIRPTTHIIKENSLKIFRYALLLQTKALPQNSLFSSLQSHMECCNCISVDAPLNFIVFSASRKSLHELTSYNQICWFSSLCFRSSFLSRLGSWSSNRNVQMTLYTRRGSQVISRYDCRCARLRAPQNECFCSHRK